MFEIAFDSDTGGIILSGKQQVNMTEWKPVYYEELRIRHMDAYWEFEDTENPYMWTDGSSYYYRGIKYFELGIPESVKDGRPLVYINVATLGHKLMPIDVEEMLRRNRKQLDILTTNSMQRIHSAYREYADKVDIVRLSYSSGKDSTAMIDLIMRTLPVGSYSVLNIDTGMEIAAAVEMTQSMKKLCEKQHIPFYTAKYKKNPEELWKVIGPPSTYNRWCCHVMQSAPSRIFDIELSGNKNVKALIYIGNRAGESPLRNSMTETMNFQHNGNTIQSHPIIDWNSAEVYLYIMARKLELNKGYRYGARRIGCKTCPMTSLNALSDNYLINADEVEPWNEIIRNTYAPDRDSEDSLDDVINIGAWTNRFDGTGTIYPDRYCEYFSDDCIVIELKNPNCDWKEWMKTIAVLREDDGKYNLDFRGRNYSLSHRTEGQSDIFSIDAELARTDREFWSLFVQVLRKACFCEGCYFCDAECLDGCIQSGDRGVHISDDCNHCGKCHTAQECFVFKSQYRKDRLISL